MNSPATAQDNAHTDRTRWLALYVLCAGMLMIVLDATIVNVALPSIQDDLGFSQNNLAWVVNAYMIPFGGLLLLAGRIGDLVGQRRVFLAGLAVFTGASLVCALSQSQEMLVGARFVQGIGGAMASAVILGMIVTMFPEPANAGESDRRLRLRRLGRRLDRAAARRRPHRRDQLALDLHHQPPDRDRRRLPGAAPGRGPRGDRPARGRRLPRRRPDHGLADARRLHDPADHRVGLGRHPHARAQRRLRGAAGRLHPPPGDDRQPADAAAPLPLAQRRRRQRAAGAAGRRHVRDVLPRRPLPAAGARLQRPRGRPRLPADDDRDGDALARLLGKTDHALRAAHDADPRRLPGRRRAAAVRPHAGRRQLPDRPAAALPADRASASAPPSRRS